MLNQSYRLKTVLTLPIKNLGSSFSAHKACSASLINKTLSAFDIQAFPGVTAEHQEPTFIFQSSSKTTAIPEIKPQQIFTNTFSVNKSFRHKTLLTGKFL